MERSNALSRRGNSGFLNGHPKLGGRRKGTPNKSTVLLKDAIARAAEAVGEDGCGKNGLIGYLKWLAVREPQVFASLLAKLLPLQVAASASLAVEEVPRIHSGMSIAEATEAYARTLAAGPNCRLIEHEPPDCA